MRVGCYGKEVAPPIILTHGWGENSKEWDYLKRGTRRRFSAYCVGICLGLAGRRLMRPGFLLSGEDLNLLVIASPEFRTLNSLGGRPR
jgi:pimeloyl-ACP methyl ester carboxylesterase